MFGTQFFLLFLSKRSMTTLPAVKLTSALAVCSSRAGCAAALLAGRAAALLAGCAAALLAAGLHRISHEDERNLKNAYFFFC